MHASATRAERVPKSLSFAQVWVFLLLAGAVPACAFHARAEEDLIVHTALLRQRVAGVAQAHLKPRVRLQMSGGQVDAVVLGAADGKVALEIQNNRIDAAWRSIEEEECYEIYRGAVLESDAEGSFSLAVLAHELNMPEVAARYETQALTADPKLSERVQDLARQYAPINSATKPGAKNEPAAPPPPEIQSAKSAAASVKETGMIGPRRKPGAPDGAQVVDKLVINKPGVYENLIVDGGFKAVTLVRILCDHVVLRNCTVRNSTRNGVEVYAKDVTIEGCLIHHMLAGTYKEQYDAHGITGCPTDLTVRDCEIHHVSGDSLQFDPNRAAWTNVQIEHCALWTGPLEADAAGFKKGERPGENALDTKQDPKNPRSEVTVRYCYAHGFGQGQITNQAAFNIKDHVHAVMEDCVLAGNDVCFRLRGAGKHGGATAQVTHCVCYSSKIAVRAEDKVLDLRLTGMAYAPDVKQKLVLVDGGAGKGFENKGDLPAPPLEAALKLWGLR